MTAEIVTAPPTAAAAGESDELSIPLLARAFVPYIPFVAALALVAGGVAFALASTAARTYTAHVSFMPERVGTTSALGGLAAQFGIASGGEAGQSPAYYIELLRSREILRRVGTGSYSIACEGRLIQAPLGRVILCATGAEARSTADAVGYLRSVVRATPSPQAGLVTVSVTTVHPQLSAQIAGHLLRAVDEFNRETARDRARQQRAFTEQGLSDARADLHAAEARLQGFLQRNRDVGTFSSAALERERLSREVALRQQLYIALAQAFAQASMEESRNAPKITVIDRPEVPHAADPRGRAKKAVLGSVLGALLGVVLFLMRETGAYPRRRQAIAFPFRRDADAVGVPPIAPRREAAR